MVSEELKPQLTDYPPPPLTRPSPSPAPRAAPLQTRRKMRPALLALAASAGLASATLRSAPFESASPAAAEWRLDAAQVRSVFYSESLCPDCVHFATGVWSKAYRTQGIGYGSTVGDGQGMIVKRGFPAPPSYHTDRLREARVGHYFDVMILLGIF